MEAIFDIEANGLENPTKIWCLSVYYKNSKGEDCFHSTTDYNQMRGFFSKAEVLIGHNIIRWDIPHIERILGIEINPKLVIDTLTLSWYLYPNRNTHGLEAYGEELGVKKPPIENWDDEDMLQEYIHRCEEDVQINKRVLEKQIGHLKEIYGEDTKRILGYLAFKTKCARLQEESRWKLDVDRVKRGLKELEEELENKTTEVAKAMPKVPTKRKMSYPARPRKKDGSLSVTGQNWYSALEDLGLPEDHLEDIEIVTGFKDPNPGSHQQVKDWLFGLGWKPETFKYVKEEDGERKIPQIKQEFSVDLCPSIKKLQEKEPAIEHLEGIGVIKHRIGILKGFLRDMTDDGYLSARVAGLTNTLRFIHSELVNLPAASAPYAKDIRGSLIAPEGYELMGSDMSSLEDRTKQHYMWPHDPEYVKEMMVDDFDPHLALAEFAGALTPEQVRAHKDGRENHKATRHIYKTANYACLPTDLTEVLTKNGFVPIGDLSVGDIVVGYDPIKGFSYTQPIIGLINKEDDVYILGNKIWSVECTKDHRWVIQRRRSQNYDPFVTSEDLSTETNIVNAAPYRSFSGIGISDARVLGWILSEGYIEFKNKSARGSISQSTEKYYKELKWALDTSRMKYSERLNSRGSDVVVFSLSARSIRELFDVLQIPYLNKHEIDYSDLIINRMGNREREEFLNSFFLGDGHYRRGVKVITQKRGSIADAVILAANLNGYKTYVCNKSQDVVDITLSNNNKTSGQRLSMTYSRTTSVSCITVPSGAFIMRQGDTITITGNCTYGAGGPTVARGAGISVKEGKAVVDAYRKKNWAIDVIANEQKVITTSTGMWLYNPVSRLYYSLRYEKDIFSTLNQGTGVYCFDTWIAYILSKREQLTGQFHDEIILTVKKGEREEVTQILKEAIEKVNDTLNLNRELDIDIQFGDNYGEIH